MDPRLKITGLKAGYRNRIVLDGVDLPPLPGGSLVALVGANGAGKSTLLKAMIGLIPATGEIRWGEELISALPMTERLCRIGYLPQAPPQASTLMAYESLLTALHATRPGIPRSLAEIAIETVFHELGLQDLAFPQLAELSGGQRQMVGLAQVIVRQPQLLLLDEPTSALDLRWQLRVLMTVQHRIEQEQAVALFAIHDLNLALRFCTQIVVLSQGKVLAAGSPLDVLDADLLGQAYGVQGRIEQCSLGYPIVLVDRELPHPNPYSSRRILL